MLVVPLATRTVTVTFAHPTEAGRRHTVCRILQLGETGSQPIEVAVGKTACSWQDNFSKIVGRKIALERALCQHETYGSLATPCSKCGAKRSPEHVPYFAKDERSLIWLAYHTVSRRLRCK